MFNIVSLFHRKKEAPDRPILFGYKCAWLAIKTENMTEILEAFTNIGFSNKKSANWESGLRGLFRNQLGYNSDLLFITPPVNGWTFVIGRYVDSWLDCPSNEMGIGTQKFLEFVKLFGKKIPNFFLFSSIRTINHTVWAMIESGAIKRAFACSEDELIYEQGPKTPEEKAVLKYKEDLVNPLEEWEELEKCAQEEWKELWGEKWREKWAECCNLPHEDDMLELASKWSINPLTLNDQQYEDNLGVGFLVKLTN